MHHLCYLKATLSSCEPGKLNHLYCDILCTLSDPHGLWPEMRYEPDTLKIDSGDRHARYLEVMQVGERLAPKIT